MRRADWCSLPVGAVHMVMGTHGVGTIRSLAAAHAEAGQVLVAAPVLAGRMWRRPDNSASWLRVRPKQCADAIPCSRSSPSNCSTL